LICNCRPWRRLRGCKALLVTVVCTELSLHHNEGQPGVRQRYTTQSTEQATLKSCHAHCFLHNIFRRDIIAYDCQYCRRFVRCAFSSGSGAENTQQCSPGRSLPTTVFVSCHLEYTVIRSRKPSLWLPCFEKSTEQSATVLLTCCYTAGR